MPPIPADPIDFVKGDFLFAREGIRTGIGESRAEQILQLGARTQDGPLGGGWPHSLASTATRGSDGF